MIEKPIEDGYVRVPVERPEWPDGWGDVEQMEVPAAVADQYDQRQWLQSGQMFA